MTRDSALRLAVLSGEPHRHLSSVFREWHQRTSVHATVLYGSVPASAAKDVGSAMLDGYCWWTAKDAGLVSRRCSILRHLDAVDPEAVLLDGWGSTITRLGLAWAVFRRRPRLLYACSPPGPRSSVRTRQEIVIKRLLRTISRVLTRDVFEEQWFLARGVPPERLHRVGPADSVGAPVAQRLPHSTGIGQQIKIGYVGELAAEGGAPFFLSALALVQGLGKEWEAFVIGDGSARPGLEQLCVQLHLDGRVAFLGRLRPEEVHNRMGACTVLVVAADVPCGYSLLAEATTLGIGVIIVSRIPAASASDVVQDGSGVLVYQPGDVLQLANAIESVMQLRQRPAATSDAGREHSASRSSATFARHLENAVRAAVR